MFHKMIMTARDRWLSSTECTVTDLINYIYSFGQMRDAQIEAIKTYLFLKIACDAKPLYKLFIEGKFNNISIDDIELSTTTRDYLKNNKAAAALFEYACLKNDSNEQVSSKMEDVIRKEPESIDYEKFFKDIFYGVTYTDYLFSLPMGAGKTFLMAAFIYLDLYFAENEPSNPAFAHNFIIFAPSGLKSSVVPSLKTIQKFEPSWIIPEPAASNIKRKLIFEVLDEDKTSNKSNKTKNPNVQKISIHQPLDSLFGLVAVTNAEKVILDRIVEKNGTINMFEDSDDIKDRSANELRNIIGKLPSLSIFIDEVHHAVSDEIKLRAVVNKWAENGSVNSVVGFSGTPYLEKGEKVTVSDDLSIKISDITNVVYYYPLIKGVGNFLKKPTIIISDYENSKEIINKGVRAFFDNYKDTVYENGLVAKLGIYCGTIEKCEEIVYPLVSSIIKDYDIPQSAILKFHKGNKVYPQPADSQLQFETLDSPISNIRVVLLVQIGKEGWDCRSLTGIILSQAGDCPQNMVLQTSCRCLRQVIKHNLETAVICLNNDNAEKLEKQLKQQQHITLSEFSSADNSKTVLKRYNRCDYLKLPKIDYYQLKISYDTIIVEDKTDTESEIVSSTENSQIKNIIKTTDLSMETYETTVVDEETGTEQATFLSWIYGISKSSFNFIAVNQLLKYQNILNDVFMLITYEKDGYRYFSSKIDKNLVEANIRKAFYEKRDFTTVEELIPDEAELLNIKNFSPEIKTDSVKDYYPEQTTVENIVLDDKGKFKSKPELIAAIQALENDNNPVNEVIINNLKKQVVSHPQKNRSFHYMPYHTDSDFEQTFLKDVLSLSEIEALDLEVYYNGDRDLTEFKIKCYKQKGKKWSYIGKYTPDFIIIKRKENKIHKAIIVETKGKIYANDPTFRDKREFMETEFTKKNNEKFGYDRFDYLYIEDGLKDDEIIKITHSKICEFFEEN